MAARSRNSSVISVERNQKHLSSGLTYIANVAKPLQDPNKVNDDSHRHVTNIW